MYVSYLESSSIVRIYVSVCLGMDEAESVSAQARPAQHHETCNYSLRDGYKTRHCDILCMYKACNCMWQDASAEKKTVGMHTMHEYRRVRDNENNAEREQKNTQQFPPVHPTINTAVK